MEIFSLVGRMALDGKAAVEEGLKQVDSKAEQLAGKLKQVGTSVTDAGGTMTKWVTGPIAAVGGGMLAIAKSTANAGDEIQKMALRTGFSTEALSEYKHAAELSGTSLDSVEKAVKRMQKSLLDAERGMSTATNALDSLGLSVEDLQGLSPEEQFDKMAMALAGIVDPSMRAAVAQEVFGRAGTDLLPMLDAGADGIAEMRQEARDLGIVFDQEAADAAAQFNDDMDRLKKGFTGAFQELGKNLIPILVEDFLPLIRDNIIPIVQDFGERIGKIIEWFSNLDPKWQKVILTAIGFTAALGPLLLIIGKVITVVGTITGALPVLGAAFTALTGPVGLIVAAIAGVVAIGVTLYKNWDVVRAKLSQIWGSIKETASNVWNSIWDTIKGVINWIIGGINKMINALNKIRIKVPEVKIPLVGKVGGFEIGLPRIPTIPELAKGGEIISAGSAIVGEAGPELLHLPKGAKVRPIAAAGGITINIYDPHLFNERDADKLGDLIANRIRQKTGLRI